MGSIYIEDVYKIVFAESNGQVTDHSGDIMQHTYYVAYRLVVFVCDKLSLMMHAVHIRRCPKYLS